MKGKTGWVWSGILSGKPNTTRIRHLQPGWVCSGIQPEFDQNSFLGGYGPESNPNSIRIHSWAGMVRNLIPTPGKTEKLGGYGPDYSAKNRRTPRFYLQFAQNWVGISRNVRTD